MLSFFPTPYLDELLYSVIARYHLRSGNTSFKQTLLELLEYSSQQSHNLDLPNNLEYLVKHLPLCSDYSVEYFIWEHTLYPFFKSLLTPSEHWLLKDQMRKKFNSSISGIAKIPFSDENRTRQFLKFCPTCLEQDVEKYGEAYWHRTHQVPGIFICLTHNTVLLDSSISAKTASLSYNLASIENCLYEIPATIYPSHVLQQILQLAKDIEWLMNRSFDFKGLQWLRSRYQDYLVKHNFIEVRANAIIHFDQPKFWDAILGFYSQEFWEVVKPEAAQKLCQYLRYCLLGCDMNPTIDRVAHILLIRFLSNSLEEFFLLTR